MRLKPEDDPKNLVNIAHGMRTIAAPQVNVDKAVYISENHSVEFEIKGAPNWHGFWKPTERKIKVMAEAKKELIFDLKFFMMLS